MGQKEVRKNQQERNMADNHLYTPSQAQLAEMLAITDDVSHIKETTKRFLEDTDLQDYMRRALYDSAFIAFRRLVKDSHPRVSKEKIEGGNIHKIRIYQSPQAKQIISSAEINFQRLMEIANRVVAHRSSVEAKRVRLVNENKVEGVFSYDKKAVQDLNKLANISFEQLIAPLMQPDATLHFPPDAA
ncbi:MAG: hypothetical protein AAGD96_22205 [Chloroflexota bacterium]